MMRHIYLFAVWFQVLGLGQSIPESLDGALDKVWQIPQKDGSLRSMTHSEALKEALEYEAEKDFNARKFNKIRFFLYTPDHPTEPVEIDKNKPETLNQSTFNNKYPTRFMIHGWNGGYNTTENRLIREALLLQGRTRQFNFIAVDWSVYAESNLYISSQKSVSKAGRIIAEFIDWLHDYGKLSFDNLALYGHSLGAHVAGFTGKNVKGGKIHTIIGLDPAMPLFEYGNVKGRLAETDAKYVESIHTNGGTLGFHQPIGRASFYPNGGRNQPGCGLNVGCSHGRSVEFLAEALALSEKNRFVSSRCKEFDAIKDASCKRKINSRIGVRLGNPNNSFYAKGIYYLETNSKSPYGIKDS
ncbi:endothelial lipase-like [Eupeodes corollae]|uniref:endothelial lipase-like n=1 Tax=Eupeodes corollae TaxID=290404 RepID=UPI0024936651|nr:endothelial lipase-like [Eupeodes corollae]